MNDDSGNTTRQRSRTIVSLTLLLAVGVVTVTGVIAFLRPFSLLIVSLHVVFGLAFALATLWHIKNNFPHLRRYAKSKAIVFCTAAAVGLAAVVVGQIPPVRALMRLSPNTGAAAIEVVDEAEQLRFDYAPADDYRLRLDIQKGSEFPPTSPCLAIWLENESAYHIHTLYTTDGDNLAEMLPYWSCKRREWFKAKEKFDSRRAEGLDGFSGATRNDSFDPRDYVLAENGRYSLMVEINASGDANERFPDADVGQPSLIYAVEIVNSEPAHFQVLSRFGIPEQTEGEVPWQIGYDLSGLTTALKLIDSALVRIDRMPGVIENPTN